MDPTEGIGCVCGPVFKGSGGKLSGKMNSVEETRLSCMCIKDKVRGLGPTRIGYTARGGRDCGGAWSTPQRDQNNV